MRPKALALVALAVAVSALSSWEPAHAATTCPLYLQSRVASTLTNPLTEIVKDNSTSSSTKKNTGSSSSGDDDATVGSGDGGNSDAGSTSSPSPGKSDGSSTGSGSAGVPATTTPSTTTATTTTTASPTPTTATPTTTRTPVTTAPSSGSSTGTGGAAGSTTPAPGTRFLQVSLNVGVSAGSSTGITATTGTTTTPTTTTPTKTTATTTTTGTTTTVTLTPATNTVTSTTNSTSSTGSQASGNTTTSTNSTSLTSEDTFTCDETFYNQWTTLGITCGGQSIDVDAAVAASSCVIYSGSVGTMSGSTCVSICSFPACNSGTWSYGRDNGLSSSVYANYGLDSFMTSAMKTRLTARSSASSAFLANSTMTSNKQCAYASESSFSSCSCSAMLVNASTATDAQKMQERKTDEAEGVITEDSTSTAGNVIGPTSKSVAGVTVVMSTIAAVASSVVSGAGTASASVAAAGANVAVVTVEICQFAVFINQLNLTGKSAALSIFGKQMAPAAFTFLPFGKMKNSTDDADSDGSDENTRRRLMQYSRRLATDVTAPDSGIAKYSRTLGIEEDMLFVVTLAGVFVVMAGILALFGIAYFASGFFMSREEFMTKFFDKVIGLELLILILSQYTIGVTGTYQIYHSVEMHDATNPKCILAAVSLLFLAFGIIVYGYVIVKKHEEEIRDVGTVAHMKKPVNARYGPLYDEYKFKNRFFFAPKLMVALFTGCATGYVGAEATYQVSFILGVHIIFFFYLEIKSPHHSRFVQTTTSFVTIMKIAVLVLTFFLISAAAADGFPSELQNGISLAIVGLNLFVLFLLMIRSLYSFWKKYQLQRDAKFDQEDEQTAQEYFKDETPAQKERVPLASQNSQYQQQQSQNQQLQQQQSQSQQFQQQQSQNQQYQQRQSQNQQQQYAPNVTNSTHNPYVNGNANEYNIDDDNKYTEDIRLRSGTHMQEATPINYESRAYDVNRRTAANHYIADEHADYERRNNVVEL